MRSWTADAALRLRIPSSSIGKGMHAMERFGVERKFARYISQNILGMIGISAYVLADTCFISQAEGARGITALNLVLPLYSLIFAIGSMTGVGAATRFSIQSARGDRDADFYFSNAIEFAVIFSMIFVAMGAWIPDRIVAFLGGDAEIVKVGTPYTRIFMVCAPFFMLNYIFGAFVRNDGDPSLAMAATLSSSLFNIVMDYILMFPLKLGMAGAALATGLSPLVGIAVAGIHFLTRKNTIQVRWTLPDWKKLIRSWQLGTSAFVGEIASGVTTVVFNFLILGIAGNDGVAAYGIVANAAIVATAIFNGVAQGSQPLLSDYYGKNEQGSLRRVLMLSVGTAFVLSLLVILVTNQSAETLIAVFNSEQNQQMASYALQGVRLYFIGFLFAGFNIVGTGFLSATESAGWAFVTSILRGFVAIAVCAFTMSRLFGMTGIWLAFAAAELLTAVVMASVLLRRWLQ